MSKKPPVPEYEKDKNIKLHAIDTHAHLDRYEDYERIILSMKDDGLSNIVFMTGSKESLKLAREVCKMHKNIYYMFGIHPYDIAEFDSETIEIIENLSKDEKCVGVGEFGLDYHGEFSEEDIKRQRDVMEQQIISADRAGLPISLHIRDANEDAIKILKDNKKYLNHGGIIHCFSGNTENVKEYLDLGFYISYSGSITFNQKEELSDLQKSVSLVPKDKILIETDSPFLTPHPYRGRENEPKYVLLTAKKLAQLKGIEINEFINLTNQNAKRLLKIK